MSKQGADDLPINMLCHELLCERAPQPVWCKRQVIHRPAQPAARAGELLAAELVSKDVVAALPQNRMHRHSVGPSALHPHQEHASRPTVGIDRHRLAQPQRSGVGLSDPEQ